MTVPCIRLGILLYCMAHRRRRLPDRPHASRACPHRTRNRRGTGPPIGRADLRDAARERARLGVSRAAHVPELRRGQREHGVQLARERRERRVAAVVGGDALHVYSVRLMVIVSLDVVD